MTTQSNQVHAKDSVSGSMTSGTIRGTPGLRQGGHQAIQATPDDMMTRNQHTAGNEGSAAVGNKLNEYILPQPKGQDFSDSQDHREEAQTQHMADTYGGPVG